MRLVQIALFTLIHLFTVRYAVAMDLSPVSLVHGVTGCLLRVIIKGKNNENE